MARAAKRRGGRVLSHQIEAIEYIHADDGLPYRHDFERGDSEIRLQGDGSVQVRNPRRRLWGLYDGQPFLENPPMAVRRKRKATKRAATKRRARRTRQQARKVNPNTGVTMARKRSARRRRNPAPARAHRRRRVSSTRHRRNPPGFSPRMLVNTVTEGVIGGAEVVAGKAAVRLARSRLGYAAGTTPAAAIEAGLAIAAGMVVSRFLGAEHGRRVLYGGMSAPIEQFVREAVKNSPEGTALVHEALGDYGAYDTIMAYPDYAAITAGDAVGDAGAPAYLGAGSSFPYGY